MRILALDLGSLTGWASFVDGQIESGTKEFRLERGESPGIRFIKFNNFLSTMISLIRPSLIIYEMPHLRGGYASDLLIGMSTRVQEKCVVEKIEYKALHSATLKRISCGSGRANKEDMMKKAKELYPTQDIQDDNQADALLLLNYGIELMAEKF